MAENKSLLTPLSTPAFCHKEKKESGMLNFVFVKKGVQEKKHECSILTLLTFNWFAMIYSQKSPLTSCHFADI